MGRRRVPLARLLAVGFAVSLVASVPAVASTAGNSTGPNVPAPGSASAPGPTDEAMRYQGGRVLLNPRVFVVFWGSEWGGADAKGMPTLDPLAVAPVVVDFLGRLGGPGDHWSTILTQYCAGAPLDATSCGPRTQRIAPLVSSPLRGWWVDTSAAPGMSNLAAQQGDFDGEISAALNHFNAAGPDDIVVLMLPPGKQSAPCGAFHTYGKTKYGQRAAIVLSYPTEGPYCFGTPPVCDLAAPADCLPKTAWTVQQWISHEYAETVTDPFPYNCLATKFICGWNVTNAPVYEGGDGATFTEIAICGRTAFVQLNGKKVVVNTLWSNTANGGQGGCVSTYINDKRQF